ncbi:MAG: hypothetical protein GY854_10955 [Deltaproteobacteria bacterium]|nr:hypothetical protein [Deltaproteobacteria bacterium]
MKKRYIIICFASIVSFLLVFSACSNNGCNNQAPGVRKKAVGRQGKLRKGARRAKRAGRKETGINLPFVDEKTTLSALHVLITYKGADRAATEITRTKEEALARAMEAHKKLLDGSDFGEVAREYSECPSKNSGGDLGTFRTSTMVPEFSNAVLALKHGELSEPVESPSGFHIIKRKKLEKIYTRHILVQHKGVKYKLKHVTRSKREARNIIEKVAIELRKPNADFAKIAQKHSDCTSKRCGGALKPIGRLGIVPHFEKAAFALEEWELSDVVKTRFGFHIIQRIP